MLLVAMETPDWRSRKQHERRSCSVTRFSTHFFYCRLHAAFLHHRAEVPAWSQQRLRWNQAHGVDWLLIIHLTQYVPSSLAVLVVNWGLCGEARAKGRAARWVDTVINAGSWKLLRACGFFPGSHGGWQFGWLTFSLGGLAGTSDHCPRPLTTH